MMAAFPNASNFPDIPFSLSEGQPSPSVGPAITVDALPPPSRIPSSTSTAPPAPTPTRTEQAKSSIAAPSNDLSNSELTAVIVVPIVLLAILPPILIVWFLSWRRRKRNRSQRSTPPKIILLENEKEKSLMGTHPQERSQKRRSTTKRNTASLPPPRRPPRHDPEQRRSAQQFLTTPLPNKSHLSEREPRRSAQQFSATTMPDNAGLGSLEQRRSAQQFPTTPIPDNADLSGFNFDFSRRASVFSTRSSAQHTTGDSSIRPSRPSSAYTWVLFPPPTSTPVAIAQPYFPPQIRTPNPSEKDTNEAKPVEPLSPSTGEVLPHPDSYGKVHRRSSPRPLNDENLSVHNSSDPRYSPSQPPHIDAVSEVSGLSFDPDVWVATQRSRQDTDVMSEVSALEAEAQPGSSINPHQIV